MMWLLQRVAEKSSQLKNQICCVRCKNYRLKYQPTCRFCAHLSEVELAVLLAQRKAFRMSLGKMMFVGAIFFVALVIAAGVIY